MQYRVPQNVDIEDRVIGPLSLRQFIFLLVGTSIILVLYFILVGPLRLLFWLLAIVIGAITGVFTFARYGDQPFEVFALGAIKTLVNPRMRIWKREVEADIKVKKAPSVQQKNEKRTTKSLLEVQSNLSRLAQIVDSGGHIEESSGERIASVPKNTTSVNDAPDLLNRGETDNANIDPMIERASGETPKREPLVSEVSSISPDQNFDYPKIEITENNSYKKVK